MPFYECLHPVIILVSSKKNLPKMLLCFLMLLVLLLGCEADESLGDRARTLMKSSRVIDGYVDFFIFKFGVATLGWAGSNSVQVQHTILFSLDTNKWHLQILLIITGNFISLPSKDTYSMYPWK